jgi:cysteine desulfurase
MIYLDHNATTPVAAEVLEAMLPWFRERYGNPGSAHALGHLSDGAVVNAREQVAAMLHASPGEIVFTGSATEAINHAIRGALEAFPTKRHVVTTAVEHPAVQSVLQWASSHGADVTVLPVDSHGQLDLAAVDAALRPETALLSVMAANNESGVCFPMPEIARIAKAKGVWLHVDATQAIGKIPVDAQAWGADLLNLSAHKFQGPKGVGALYIRRGLRLKPFLLGGGQERGRRGGTENVPGIVGLGAASALAAERLPGMDRVRALRDRMEQGLLAIPDVRILGAESPRLPNTTLAAFSGIEGEALLLKLNQQGICVSTGSACSTGHREPSHVLRAMQIPDAFAKGTLRLSLGWESTDEDIARVLEVLPPLVAELRSAAPFSR